MEYILLFVLSYLLGSVPFSYLMVKAATGKDIRDFGSGNVGATNAYRVAGLKWGIISFVLDFSKGFCAVTLLTRITGGYHWDLMTAAAGVLLGHMFTVFLKFKGGKGAATGLGVMFSLSPIGAAVGLAVWGITLFMSKIVSLSTILAALVVAVSSFMIYNQNEINIFIAAMSALVIYRHKSNIMRMVHGRENKI